MRLTLIIVFAFFSFTAKGQDLYDYKHSIAYAEYLKQTQQYSLAAEEFERVLFMDPSNDTIVLELVKLYSNLDILEKHINRFDKADVNSITKREINYLIAKSLLLDYKHDSAIAWISLHDFNEGKKEELFLINNLLAHNFTESFLKDSRGNILNMTTSPYVDLANEAIKLKYKKPWMAGTFSAIIPGTGKVYAAEFKDGLFSFIIVGSTAFQAYRGFEKKGTSSGYGWIMGGLCLGFYSGNIYGAVKSVKIFNKKIKNNISDRAEAFFRNSN